MLAACAGPARFERASAGEELPAKVELTSTPFYPQSESECGPAALATLFGAAGTPVSPATLAAEIYLPGRRGSLQPEILGAIRARGFVPYVVLPELDALLAEIAAGRPVLVLQRQGLGPWPAWHYAVAAGYDMATGTILLRSGTRARQILSLRQFMLTWDRAERWAVIALPPGDLPARPDFTHYMQAAASVEAVGASSEAARKAYVAASVAWPDEALPWLGIANVAASAGNWPEAARGYRVALSLDPRDAASLNNQAEALRQLDCSHAASHTIRSAQLRVTPGDPMYATVRDTAEAISADFAGRSDRSASDPPICAHYAADGTVP